MNKNIVELNGKVYDMASGQLVKDVVRVAPKGASAAVAAPKTAKTVHTRIQTTPHHARVSSIDVIPRTKSAATAPSAAPTVVKTAPKPVTPKPQITRATPTGAHSHHQRAQVAPVSAKSHSKPVHRAVVKPARDSEYSVAVHHKPHKPQISSTLMRKVVKKPEKGFKQSINVQTALSNPTPSLIVKKSSVYKITPERAIRAESIKQSDKISRFEKPERSVVPTSVAPIPVAPAPAEPAPHTVAPSVTHQPSTRSTDMFERAIENASHFVDTKAHAKSYRKKRRHHALSLSAATLALLLIAGFAFYQNTPGVQFKMASVRAGFNTAMPDLSGTGFAYGGVTTENGKITLGLKNQSGDVSLVQQATNWSEADLLKQSQAGTDAGGQPTYDTLTSNGVSIYRFSDSSATWIKNGVWYQLSSPASLTDEQVTALARNS